MTSVVALRKLNSKKISLVPVTYLYVGKRNWFVSPAECYQPSQIRSKQLSVGSNVMQNNTLADNGVGHSAIVCSHMLV